MGKSGALSTDNQYIKYTIEIIQNSQSTANNKSNVTVKVRFYRTNTGYTTYGTGTVYCKIDGVTYSAGVGSNQGITNSGIDLFTKTLDISHGTDGKKKLTCSAWISHERVTSSEQSYSQDLTTIPRYANITSFVVEKRDETSVTFKYSVDATCDYAWYSKDDGATWSDLPQNNIVGNLTANTSYNFKLRLRRKDSQLNTISGRYVQTTYDYPYCTNSPNFTIGNEVTLSFYNPCNRTFNFTIIANGKRIYTWEGINATSYKGINGVTSVNELYASIPNAPSGKYKVEVVYGLSVKTRDNGNTYQIQGSEKPTINGLSYKDTANSVVEITGNNQHIVQNQSILQIAYESATPKNSATISKYAFELNGVTKESTSAGGTVDFGKVNSANDLTLTLTVTDSRGLTSSKTMKITMLAHSEPTATVTLERLNNYEDETYLTVDASISSVNNKNSISVLGYRYTTDTGYSSPFVEIPNNEKQTLSLDKNSIFVFTVAIEDAFGSVFLKEYTLYKGVFPLFIDTEKNAVGINEFPAENEALRVAGGVARINDGIVLMGGSTPYLITVTEGGTLTITKWSEGE